MLKSIVVLAAVALLLDRVAPFSTRTIVRNPTHQSRLFSRVLSAAKFDQPCTLELDTDPPITDPDYKRFSNAIQHLEVSTPTSPSTIITYLHTPPPTPPQPSKPILILLHGFDSSSLEYRRLLPLLSPHLLTYAVDIPGWGFGDLTLPSYSSLSKISGIKSFIKKLHPDKKIVFCGASLGGAIALNLSAILRTPLILLDAQGFTDGVGPQPPSFLLGFGVEILKKRWLRKYANILSYFDTKKYATDDAITIGCLHTRRPGWKAGILTFIESGGFTPTVDVQRVADNKEPTLILWGEDDEVLPKDFPRMFKEKIEHAEVKYLKECGHVPHLEKSEETKELILDFINSLEQ